MICAPFCGAVRLAVASVLSDQFVSRDVDDGSALIQRALDHTHTSNAVLDCKHIKSKSDGLSSKELNLIQEIKGELCKAKETECPNWQTLKDKIKRATVHNFAAGVEHWERLQKSWGDFRKELVDASFNQVTKHLTVAEYSCAGSTSPSSDMDCSVRANNPGKLIETIAQRLRKCLRHLGCSSGTNEIDSEVVERLFDANFYGDLTFFKHATFERLEWPNETKEHMFQMGEFTEGDLTGGKVEILKHVCDKDTMIPAVNGRLKANIEALVKEPPERDARDEAQQLQSRLGAFYDNIVKNKYIAKVGGEPSVKWTDVSNDLIDIAQYQFEAYLTYAAIYDIVIADQLKIKPLKNMTEDQQKCLGLVSSKEQFAFITQYVRSVFAEKNATTDDQLLTFLKATSKYWARVHEPEVEGSESACKILIEKGLEVKKERQSLTLEVPLAKEYIESFKTCIGYEDHDSRSALMDKLKTTFPLIFGDVLSNHVRPGENKAGAHICKHRACDAGFGH